MSEHPCKVLANQIEFEKRRQTALRELIAELSDLASGRRSTLLTGQGIRLTSYSILGASGLLGKVSSLLTKLAAATGIIGVATDAAELGGDRDLQAVEALIDEAVRDFHASDRKLRQLRREYRELECDSLLGETP